MYTPKYLVFKKVNKTYFFEYFDKIEQPFKRWQMSIADNSHLDRIIVAVKGLF